MQARKSVASYFIDVSQARDTRKKTIQPALSQKRLCIGVAAGRRAEPDLLSLFGGEA
jgi:hypothetical protein